ncbi:MAG: hypothetical protein J6S05_03820 [Bacteroidaceae bacterium]|nr:hypothetical protein [Bacteroidaceae bacterium]
MRKLLLLFIMLLGVVGAWAQETETFVAPEAGKFYIIKGDHATHHWLTGVVEGDGIDVSNNKANAGVYYYDGTSLKLKDAQKYIGKNGTHISLVSSKTNVTITSHGNAGKYLINVGGHYLYNNQNDYTREAGSLTADPGNDRYTWGFINIEPPVTTLDDWDNNWSFKICGSRGFIYATENGELKGTNKASATYNAANPYHHFAIIKYGNNYYLYNVGAKKFVVKNGNSASLSDTPSHIVTLEEATDKSTDYDWVIRLNGSLTHLSDNADNGVYTNHDEQDEGTRWAFCMTKTYDASNVETKVAAYVNNITNNAFYKVCGSRGFIYATENGELKGTNKANTTYEEENPYHHFAILKYGDNYYLYNVGAKKFVVKDGNSASLSDTPSHTLTLGAATNQSTAYDLVIRLNGSLTHLSNNADNGVYTNYDGQDDGTRWAIYESGNFSPEYPLFEIKKHVEGLTFTISSATEINPLVIAIANDVKKTLVAKKLPSSADRYVHVTASNEEPELGYGQWAIYPAVAGNNIGFKIKNIATETYIYAKPGGANEDYPVVLNAEGTVFDFTNSMFAYTDGANKLYLSVPANDRYDLPLGVGTEADETLKTITFPEFSSYQVTIGTTGYTTVYSPFTAFTYSENLEIYTITSAPQDGCVELNLITSPQAVDVSNYILENQGVIIKGNSGTYTFYITDDQRYFEAKAWTDNKLSGSFTNTYVQGDAYVLSAPDGVESVGLYKAKLNKNENGEAGTTHFKNNAGKAYLPASAAPSAARFLVFSFGDDMETGITETENGKGKTENAEVYDLAGRRIQGAQKGIFIVNGKKVVR